MKKSKVNGVGETIEIRQTAEKTKFIHTCQEANKYLK